MKIINPAALDALADGTAIVAGAVEIATANLLTNVTGGQALSQWKPLANDTAKLQVLPGYVRKIGGAFAWDASAITSEQIANGCRVTGRVDVIGGGKSFVCGIMDGAFVEAGVNEFAEIDYGLSFQGTSYRVIESNADKGQILGTAAVGDIFEVRYSGTKVEYLVNGAILRTVATTAGRIFRGGMTIAQRQVSISALNFTTYADGSKLDGVEPQADVTKVASGTPEIIVAYGSDGTLKLGEIPKAVGGYALTPTGGSPFNSGVTWAVIVTNGSFSGAAPTMAGTGLGQLTLNSGPAVGEVTLAITPTYNAKSSPPVITKVKRVQDAPSPPPPSGSSFDSYNANASFSTTSYVAAAPPLMITTGAGSTSVALTAANMGLFPFDGPDGSKPCDIKWQRETSPGSGVWVDVGAAVGSSPDPKIASPEGFPDFTGGSVTNNQTDTGRAASTAYSYRLVGRRTSVTGAAAGTVSIGGSISAQG